MIRFLMYITLFYIMYDDILLACMSVLNIHSWSPCKSEIGIKSNGVVVIDGCGISCRC